MLRTCISPLFGLLAALALLLMQAGCGGDASVSFERSAHTRTKAPTATPTATPTSTPTPGGLIVLGAVSGMPGDTLGLDVSLLANAGVAGTENGISFANTAELPGGAQLLDCAVNPAIMKEASTFSFQPAGCAPGVDCERVKTLVLSLSNVELIPDGSRLYTCQVAIDVASVAGEYPLICEEPGASDAYGNSVPASCTGSNVVVFTVEPFLLTAGVPFDSGGTSPEEPTQVEVLSTVDASGELMIRPPARDVVGVQLAGNELLISLTEPVGGGGTGDLQFTLELDASAVPAGADPLAVDIFDGVGLLLNCGDPGAGGVCVESREAVGGGARVVVRSDSPYGDFHFAFSFPFSPVGTPTYTPTRQVPTSTPPTVRPTRTGTMTFTPITALPTRTVTGTFTRTIFVQTFTPTGTPVGTATATAMPTGTVAATITPTKTHTPTPTATPTRPAASTHTATVAPTETVTPRPTETFTPRPTDVFTPRPTETFTPRPTETLPPRLTDTPIPSATPTGVATPELNIGTVAGAAGTEVLVPVTLVTYGAAVSAVSTDIEYDPAAAAAVVVGGEPDCEVDERLADKLVFTSAADLPGERKRVRVGLIGLSNNSALGDGPLYSCRFRLAVDAPAVVELVNVPGASHPRGDPLLVAGGNGTIEVSAAPATLGLSSGTAAAMETVAVTARLDSRGLELAAVAADIRYDPSMIGPALSGGEPDCVVDPDIEVGSAKEVVAAIQPPDGTGFEVLRVGLLGRDNNNALPDPAEPVDVFSCLFTVEASEGEIVLEVDAAGADPFGQPAEVSGEAGVITVE